MYRAQLTEILASITAVAAAICSALIVRAQRHANLREMRPEIAITETDFSSLVKGFQKFVFQKIRNYGRGPAFNVRIDPGEKSKKQTFYGGEETKIAILGPGESQDVTFQLSFDEKTLKENRETSRGLIRTWNIVDVRIQYDDSANNTYETYYFYAIQPSRNIGHRINLASRRTRFISVFRQFIDTPFSYYVFCAKSYLKYWRKTLKR